MNSSKASFFALIRGPVMLIALGALFAIDQFTEYSFWRTWPVLLILFGALKLCEKVFSGESESSAYVPPGGTQ